MTITSSGTVVFRDIMRMTGGHLGGFRHAIAQAVAFAEEHGPQLMVDVFHRRGADPAGAQLPALPRLRRRP
ncbi:hypothetical protein ACFYV5_31200 [Streptomyces sp. NPDC003035]|uniref:hypothetical protein n=1 Tax=Streptomyces sp. NPDC003035 TaxID=3364676 RepID=UPI0036960198